MPEGPECRIIGNWLKAQLFPHPSSVQLASIEVLSGRYTKPGAYDKTRFADMFPITVTDVEVHGKFIYLVCSDFCIGFTLGMSGNFSAEQTKHARLRLIFTNAVIYFTDIRNFGTIKGFSHKMIHRKLSGMGLDPLKRELNIGDMAPLLIRNSGFTMAEFLMDQRIFAGIGNYLKAEILWHAKISPHRLASSLTADEACSLTSAINKVPRTSLENQGASIRSYTTPSGTRGKFSELFEVYGKKLDRDGQVIVKETTQDNRRTFWVPTRQR